ncbi:ABC transporter substrate-binding protein [Robbsia sp. Bb-Pol-6]|uniref:ABC transporter substrate-binding protein n=1 Tax=Robbsia betulipollinis TaxID=2981849 RepID=A0ABT3ZSU6_9BURK|nr:ABC transporter substrate-binding protein [Robbsia betulipollinis]MCY0389547.1 ABC transporter substrate-binding protein [Robbsia betulipollinis]
MIRRDASRKGRGRGRGTVRCAGRALGVMCLLGLHLLMPLRAEAAATRTITFYGNETITVPDKIERIAVAWPAENSIIAMLGYGDKIIATSRAIRDQPVFQKFVPSIKNAVVIGMNGAPGAGDLNVEAIIALHPDVIFVPQRFEPNKIAQLRRAGIAVAALHDNSMDAMVERTLITGEILGPDAQAKAQRYKTYFERNAHIVRNALATVPPDRRLKVYLANGSPNRTSGAPSLDEDWMRLGGATNIAEHWAGGQRGGATVSVEQVLAAQPDVIITMPAKLADGIRHDPQWQDIKAVRDGRVYGNPQGMFWWSRETSEEALQIIWVAKLLYPQALPQIDMRQETRDFYKVFYGYDLSDAEIGQFLSTGH